MLLYLVVSSYFEMVMCSLNMKISTTAFCYLFAPIPNLSHDNSG